MGKVILSMALIFLVGCSQVLGPETETDLASEAEAPCGFVQNSFGQRVSWHNVKPVVFYLSSSAEASLELALKQAKEVWESQIGISFIRIEKLSEGIQAAVSRDGRNIVIMSQEWPEKSYQIQALTNIYWHGNQINEADIEINTKDFSYYIEPSEPQRQIHLTSLLVHELGHALGLRHAKELPTVMWPYLDFDYVRVTLSKNDLGNIKCEY